MKRMTVASPGLWGMGGCLPDPRAATLEGGNGAPITDVVIKRIHDAVRILRLKKKPRPTETFSRGTGARQAGARPVQSTHRSEQS
jgi:hypothetical protein